MTRGRASRFDASLRSRSGCFLSCLLQPGCSSMATIVQFLWGQLHPRNVWQYEPPLAEIRQFEFYLPTGVSVHVVLCQLVVVPLADRRRSANPVPATCT